MAATQIFTGLPKWAQGILAIAGLGITAFIGWKIYSGIKESMETAKLKKEVKDVDKEIEELKESNIKPTLTSAQLSIMAGQLETSFQEAGTDEDQIKRVFEQLKNDADLLMLIKKYGVRTIRSPYMWQADFKGTLGQTLSEEMTQSDIEEYVNSVLKKKGIKFSF